MSATPRKRIRSSETIRRYNLQYRYGVTSEFVERLWERQGKGCAICRVELQLNVSYKERSAGCVIDHDHGTGIIRGLLCNECNMMLGKAQDDTVVLSNAIEYLVAYTARFSEQGSDDEEEVEDAGQGRQGDGGVQGRDPA